MKHIYFVRHGESEANVFHIHATPTTPLTPRGHEQARITGMRCSELPLQLLITSSYTRTKETAAHVTEHTGLVPVESDLFVEASWVRALWGKDGRAPESQKVLEEIVAHWGEPGYHYADEENFEELMARVDRALAFLARQPYEHIGVVTHGMFLRHLLGRAMFGPLFTPALSLAWYHSLHVMENTALCVVTYHENNLEHPWRLKIWNDHAHLADA